MMLVGDGRPGGAESISVHWNLGRLLVELLHAPRRRATCGRGTGTAPRSGAASGWSRSIPTTCATPCGSSPTTPGCASWRAASTRDMAASLFQEFARPFRGTAMRPDMRSEDDELDAAATAFREALRIDPTMTEARLRLGRVRGRQGRHADAVEELRRAAAEVTEPLLQYYAQLFLALEYEALGDTTGRDRQLHPGGGERAGGAAAASGPGPARPVRGDRDDPRRQPRPGARAAQRTAGPVVVLSRFPGPPCRAWLTEVRNAATRPAP